METTITINTDDLTADILEGIKKMFPHRVVEITIQPADTTEYIQGNAAYKAEIEERIASYRRKQELIKLKPDELV